MLEEGIHAHLSDVTEINKSFISSCDLLNDLLNVSKPLLVLHVCDKDETDRSSCDWLSNAKLDGVHISFLTVLPEHCTCLAMNIVNFKHSYIVHSHTHSLFSAFVLHYFSTLTSACTCPGTLCTGTYSADRRQQRASVCSTQLHWNTFFLEMNLAWRTVTLSNHISSVLEAHFFNLNVTKTCLQCFQANTTTKTIYLRSRTWQIWTTWHPFKTFWNWNTLQSFDTGHIPGRSNNDTDAKYFWHCCCCWCLQKGISIYSLCVATVNASCWLATIVLDIIKQIR